MRKILSVLALCLMFLLPNGMVFGKDFPAQINVPTDKIWTINFNQPVDPASINSVNIYITGISSGGNVVLSLDQKTITIKDISYLPGSKHVLHLTKNIKNINGQSLEDTTMEFTIISN